MPIVNSNDVFRDHRTTTMSVNDHPQIEMEYEFMRYTDSNGDTWVECQWEDDGTRAIKMNAKDGPEKVLEQKILSILYAHGLRRRGHDPSDFMPAMQV